MNSFSFWERETFFQHYDVLIIGSGIVGLSAAIALKYKNGKLKIGVIERGRLPSGASTKNAGFATFGSVSELIEQLARSSEDELVRLSDMRWQGLQKLISNLGSDSIGFQQLGGHELFASRDKELFEECCDKLSYFNKLLKDIIGSDDIFSVEDGKIQSFGFRNVRHLIYNKYEGQIDTGRMMKTLLRKAQSMGIIVLNSFEVEGVEHVSGNILLREKSGEVFETKKLVVTTNAFARQLFPKLDVAPGRGQVVITKPIHNLKVKGTFHYDKGFYYFRNIGNRVLFGGGRNLDFKAEETYEFGETALVQNELQRLLREVILPETEFEIDQKWSGIMGFGEKLQPIIEEIEPHVFCAVRCNGMGVAMGSLVGEQVAELAMQ